jgi:hypothetical protein
MQNEKDVRALWQFCFRLYYLKRADSAVNPEQEVRVPVDNAIFMQCAEGIIYASAPS